MYVIKGNESVEQLKAQEKLSLRGRTLVPNFFKQAPVVIAFEGLEATGHVEVAGERVALHEVDLLGEGWCVVGIRLLLIDADWVERFRRPVTLDRNGLERFRKEVEEHPEPPKVVWPQLTAKPFLKLTDHYGACATLYNDWGDGKPVAGREGEADLVEAGYERRGHNFQCPLHKVADALTLLIGVGWRVLDRKGDLVVTQTALDLQIEEVGRDLQVKGSVSFGDEEASVERVVEAYGRRQPFLPLGDGRVALLPKVSPLQKIESCKVSRVHAGELVDLPAQVAPTLEPLLRFSGFEEVSPAAEFAATLRPYQGEGLRWLHWLQGQGYGGLLADDMGLGKTVQVLALLSRMPGPHLVVAPASLLFNWRREIERFLPGRDDIELMSYAMLRRSQVGPHKVVVLDEAQAIKNPKSQTAQAACGLEADFRVALSGTPVENRPEELWSLFHFLMPGLEGDPKRVRPFVLRRTKEEVAPELPAKIEQTVLVGMEEGQEAAYNEMAGQGMEVLEKILRLRQCCCHPLLVGLEGESGKLEALLADLETVAAEGKKALVFSQFTSMLDIIGKKLDMPFVRLDGSTRDREGVVTQFQEDPEVPIFLISLKAGGVGLNLTAADYVFLYDPWWNEAAENQAIDRAHRIGREGTVIAKRYVAAGTIEEKLMELKEQKRALGHALLGEGSFTLDELEALLMR